jgi:hypothetical protein
MSRQPTVDELFIADEPDAWRAAGFTVERERCEVGAVRLRLEGPGRGRGIVAWSVRDAGSLELDGLPTTASEEAPAAGERHPNGVVSIDHVVVITPDLDRTTATLRDAGFDLRRMREGATPGGSTDPRTRGEAFFRMGEVILELVAAPAGTKIAANPDGPARLWGISFLVEELDDTAAALGDLLGEPRQAVQPGRRIATLRREAGLGPAIAFMTPGPGAIPV